MVITILLAICILFLITTWVYSWNLERNKDNRKKEQENVLCADCTFSTINPLETHILLSKHRAFHKDMCNLGLGRAILYNSKMETKHTYKYTYISDTEYQFNSVTEDARTYKIE